MEQVRQHILTHHRETVTAVIDTGETIAAGIDEWPVSDPELVRLPLERCLREQNLFEPLVGLLEAASDSLDEQLRGTPVPAPPYLTVTSRGPLCRGTLSDGRRLVVLLSLFAVTTRPPAYRFRHPSVSSCLDIDVER